MVVAGSITVAVRVRPPTSWEAARLPEPCYESTMRGDGALSTPAKPSVTSTAPLRDIVQVVDDRIITFDPDEKDKAKAFVERGFMPPGTKRYKDRRFMFDKVFSHDAHQQDVYQSTAQPLLSNLLDGYNATVFAYGATGCGKTHTISGTDEDPGIIYLTMADLFQRIEDRRDEWDVQVIVTFLEIYNEEIRDLLSDHETGSAPRGGLSIREDKTVKVVGLTELRPNSAEEVKQIVLLGNERRTQSPTHANATSSRSHAVLQVHVTQAPRTASITEQRTMGTLSIIDLAGSERAAATTNMGQRMVEGANINKSLLALGNCINALCESGGAIRHIPYRNSKLTRLLKFSLGGNCKTVMIVCVAPTSNHFDDTHNTLIYAERATKIKTKVVTRNVVNVDRHVGRYVEAINRLNTEVAELKAKLADKVANEVKIINRRKEEAKAEVERAKKDMSFKSEQTEGSILAGAICTAKLTVAKAKLAAINKRVAEINNQASSSKLSSALEAEKALLLSLAAPEEEAVKPDSSVNVQLGRSNNAGAMFEATLRAVSERRSDKLDEVSADNVKLDAKYTRADIEQKKLQKERDTMAEAADDMSQVIVKLIGMLGRSTVMIGEAGRVLDDGNNASTSEATQSIKRLLDGVKEGNDEAFMSLVGHSTAGYVTETVDMSAFNEYKPVKTSFTSFTRRISSGPAVLQQSTFRRSSISKADSGNADASTSVGSPRRNGRTPRKSLRSSMASQPYRRTSDKQRKSKTVVWKDLVDAETADAPDAGSISMAQETSSSAAARRNISMGSESEWEDEAERDDSSNFSFFSRSLSSNASGPTRRPRASHLSLGFLRSKDGRTSTLGSLAEGDESASPERKTASSIAQPRPKTYLSPTKRVPGGMKLGGLGSSHGAGGRRRSLIGGRRRSSLIPHLSPNHGSTAGSGESASVVRGGPRKVLVSSPKRPGKRSSLSNSRAGLHVSRVKPSVMRSSSLANISSGLAEANNSGADLSVNLSAKGGPRPTWK